MRVIYSIFFLCGLILGTEAQTTVGIGLYPTGSEAGLGFRLNKDKRITLDARLAKANIYSSSATPSTFVTELNFIYRAILLEKVRFHTGIGFRSDWNLTQTHKHGAIVPIGVEGFPFSFQNAGVFFEVAPFFETDNKSNWQAGMRTVAGFVFYFPKKTKKDTHEKS
ncbi:MAG: hypothetical protein HY062_13815 [Bacteroidetes bacterium]|nr:hypothetical protein [Bacteroidota bacterium]